MLRRVCNARSLLTELLVSDVEPLVSDVGPLASDVEPLVSDVETTCKVYIAGSLCPRLRRKDCVAQDHLLAEPRTVSEFVRRRALTTLHRSSTACFGSLHHMDALAASLTSPLFLLHVRCPLPLLSFSVYCSFFFSPLSFLLLLCLSLPFPTVYPAFILQHSTTTTNHFYQKLSTPALTVPFKNGH